MILEVTKNLFIKTYQMVILMSTENFDVNEVVDSFEDTSVSDLITTDSDDGVVVDLGSPVVVLETPVVEPIVEKVKTVKPEKEPKVHVKTKADFAREIFAEMFGQEGIARKDIIQAFQNPANFGELEPLTLAGAGTYYQKMAPKVVKAATAEVVDEQPAV